MPAPYNPIRLAALVEQKPLNAAEEQFKDCMKNGNPCELGDIVPDAGDETKIIRADLIRFFAQGGSEEARIGGNIIYLRGAWISDLLNLAHVPSACSLVLHECHFAKSVMMPHSAFRFLNLSGSLLKEGLVGDGVKIESDILLGKSFSSESEVRLCGAQIDGKIVCDGGKFKAGERYDNSLNAEGIKIKGDFTMCNGFVADGEVRLIGAYIGGNLSCDKGQFKNARGVAINADKVKVKGGVYMGDGLCAEGETRLINADISAGLYCDGGRFINMKKDAFCADNMKVSGSVFMRKDFFAEGNVQLLGATISGDWYCGGANFENEGGKVLVADRVRVGGNLLMQEGFSAKGEVRMSGADIGGTVVCDGVFDNNKGKEIPAFGTNPALVAQGIKVGGNLLLSSQFLAMGAVVLHNAKIGDGVVCAGGLFNGDIIAESATIGNSLVLRNTSGVGQCNLSFASAGVFDCDEKSLDGFEFILDGFSYKRFAKRQSVEFIIEWLKRHLTKQHFSSQPFEQAAKVLFEMGQGRDARKILLEKERLLTEEGQYGKWHRRLRRCWDYLAGYGYEWWTMLKVAGVIIGVCGAAFFAANCLGYIVPHQPVVMAQVEEAMKNKYDDCAGIKRPTEVVGCLLPQYPRFHSLAYSADVFIPFFALHQEQYWYPQPRKGDDIVLFYAARLILTAILWFEIIAGWILTSLFVLTITGLLKPRQSSLE